ncbi:MAG: DUF2807 domain-containing protein [Muribaculaceae bacterium]|nr:DUF2807 domain-containing protein [Muribaculaceae bacterium]
MFLKSLLTAASLLLTTTALAQSVSRYEVKIDDFTQIKMRDNINIKYVSSTDSAGLAVFYTTPEIAPQIVFANNKGKLSVEFANKKNKPQNPPTVTVYSKFLTMAENQSDSLINLTNVNSGPQLKLRVIGNGRVIANNLVALDISASITTGNGLIIVSGECDQANLTNMSVGTIQADGLKAKEVKCKLIGTGAIGCFPVNYLSVSGAGTGKVYYSGTPKTIDNSAINIKVLPMVEE